MKLKRAVATALIVFALALIAILLVGHLGR